LAIIIIWQLSGNYLEIIWQLLASIWFFVVVIYLETIWQLSGNYMAIILCLLPVFRFIIWQLSGNCLAII
jgi:hypothetical protein